jgi:hypothetical protein
MEVMSIGARHNISHAGLDAVWSWALSRSNELNVVRTQSPMGTGYQVMRRLADKRGPAVTIRWSFERRSDGVVVSGKGSSFPKKRYADITTWKLLVQSAEGEVKDLKRLHLSRHALKNIPCQTAEATFSIDGVPESKQSSLYIVSLKFMGCRTVYPFRIIKKEKDFLCTPNYVLDEFIKQCKEENVQV